MIKSINARAGEHDDVEQADPQAGEHEVHKIAGQHDDVEQADHETAPGNKEEHLEKQNSKIVHILQEAMGNHQILTRRNEKEIKARKKQEKKGNGGRGNK